MKSILMTSLALTLGSLGLAAQNTPVVNDQTMGRGRGGAPYAWNDKDKDGICDLTGRPVGQGPGFGAWRAGCRGRGAGAGWGRGMGRGRGFRGQQQQTIPAPAQK